MEKEVSAIGVLEIRYYANTVAAVDQVLKAADVKIVGFYKKLGGRLCHVILSGDSSAVEAAVEAALAAGAAAGQNCVKVAAAIHSPHPEIVKLLNMTEEEM